MLLTDVQCRNAKAETGQRKLSDRHGLFLLVRSTGLKSWRWKYRFHGKEKLLTFGTYPAMSLADAREAHADAMKLLKSGVDPSLERKRDRVRAKTAEADTFEQMARGWHRVWAKTKSPDHAAKVMQALERDVFPRIGPDPIGKIDGRTLLSVLNVVVNRGALDQAHRMCRHMAGVFDHAENIGLIERNPARRLSKVLPPVEHGSHPAAGTLPQARELLEAVEALNAFPGTKLASRLMALTAVRTEALRKAEPKQFEGLDGPEPIWRIPAANMKLSAALRKRRELEFVIPLSPASVAIVKLAHQLSQGSPWLFPGTVNPHQLMSEGTLERLYKRVAATTLKHVPHGWRATFSTIMNERAERVGQANDRAVIELMLAHRPSGVEASYNRANYMARRREIANEWAELLLNGLPAASTLITGRKR